MLAYFRTANQRTNHSHSTNYRINQSQTNESRVNEPQNNQPRLHQPQPTSHIATNHISTNQNQPITYRPTPAQSTNSNAWPCPVLSGGCRQRRVERGRHIHGFHALRQVVGQGAPSGGRKHASGVRSRVTGDSSKRGRGTRKKQNMTSRYLFSKPLTQRGVYTRT